MLRVLHLTHKDSLRPNQILSDNRFIQICSYPLIPTQNSLSLTQIHPISIRFALTHTDSCNLTHICLALSRFTQIRSDSRHFSESRSDSHDLVQTCSDPFKRTLIHSDSHCFTPDSFRLPQTRPDSLRFTQICSDKLQLINPEGKREILPLSCTKGKGKGRKPPFHP